MKNRNQEQNPVICVADEDEELSALICRVLGGQGWDARAAHTGAAAVRMIDGAPGALLLLNYTLKDMAALETLLSLRERELEPPFIIMTGPGSERFAADMMKMGALDYIVKDTVFLDMLPRVVKKAYGGLNARHRLLRAEKLARESSARYSELFNTLFDPIIVHDYNGRIIEVNRAACWIYGFSRSEFLGMRVPDLSPRFSKHSPGIYKIIERQGHAVFETEHKTRYDSVFPVEVHASRIIFNDSPAYIAIIRDISTRKENERTLERRLRFERVIADISARFVKERDRDRAIADALADMGAFSGADRAFMFLFRDNGRFADLTHEWCAPGIPPKMSELQNLDMSEFPWWMEQLHNGRHILIDDVNGMAVEAAAERRLLQVHGVVSMAVFPVFANDALAGFIGYDFRTARHSFTEEDKNMPRVVADMIGSLLERRAAETALRESEARFRRIAESAPAIIFRWTPGYGVEYINSFVEDITGWTVEQVTGNSGFLMSKVHPEDVTRFMAVLQAGPPPSGRPRPLELRMFTADNRMIWIELRLIPLFDEQGRIESFEGIATDVTERKTGEAALRESEARFRRIAENIPDGIFRWSVADGLEYTSPACFRITGYTPEELMGNPMRALENVFQSNPGLSEYFNKVMQGGLFTNSRELQFVRKDGETITLDARMTDIRDGEGNLTAVEGAVRDITEQKRDERERASLREQLLHAQKMEAIGTLAGGIAHDFNNMLTIINSHAQLLAMKKDAAHPDSELVAPILEGCRRARDLTAELLTLAHKKQLDVTMTSVNNVVNELLELIKHGIHKNIRIETGLEPESPLSAMDHGQIIQSLLNICNNAFDAMPGGGVLKLETRRVELDAEACRANAGAKPGAFVRIRISDNGAGIGRDILPKIFEPFFTTKDVGKGSGLGLSLAYGIIKKHGGIINVTSEPGRGTAFDVFLPVVQAPPQAAPTAEFCPIQPHSGTLLIVDDEPDVLKTIRNLLATFGYTILSAGGGREAIGIFREKHGGIDAVVLDMIMPGTDGRDVFHAVRNIDPDARVILVSGFNFEGHVDELMRDGAFAYVQKPFDINELCNTIYSAVANLPVA